PARSYPRRRARAVPAGSEGAALPAAGAVEAAEGVGKHPRCIGIPHLLRRSGNALRNSSGVADRSTAVVPRPGVEPGRPCGHRFLRPTRLPVPPPRRTSGRPRPYHWPVRAGLALLVISILTACGPVLAPSAAITPGGTGAANASAPRISAPPVTPPTPPGTNLPAFACSDFSGGKTGVANTINARA